MGTRGQWTGCHGCHNCLFLKCLSYIRSVGFWGVGPGREPWNGRQGGRGLMKVFFDYSRNSSPALGQPRGPTGPAVGSRYEQGIAGELCDLEVR